MPPNRYPSVQETLQYIKHEKSFNVMPGDVVFIFRKAENFEGGWIYPWTDEMDSNIGKSGIVQENKPDGRGILIDTWQEAIFYYPYTCLRIIR